MRNAIVNMPTPPSVGEDRRLLRSAVRQLESAELYLASVTYMDLGDPEVDRSVSRMRSELEGLRRYLIDRRDGTHA